MNRHPARRRTGTGTGTGTNVSTGLRRRAALSWLGLATATGLAGCGSGLLPKPAAAPALYGLDDGAGPAAPPPSPSPSPSPSPVGMPAGASTHPCATGLLIAMPRAAPGLDTRWMAYQRQPQRTEHYADSAWLDTPPRLLAPLLVRAAEATGAFGVVLLAPAAAATRWRLETELLRLQQNFGSGGPSQLRLTLRAVLVDSSSRTVLATREFDTSLPAASEDAAGGAAAAQRAALQVARQLAQFCAQAAGRTGG